MSGIVGISPNMNSGVVGGSPEGTMRHVHYQNSYTSNITSTTQIYNQQIAIRPGSKVKIEAKWHFEDNQSATDSYSSLYLTGDTNSGLSAGTSGYRITHAMDHAQVYQTRKIIYGFVVVSPTITNPTYGLYWHLQHGSPYHSDVISDFGITEIF